MNQKSIQRNRVALVVGSGAVKCAAALGLWRVLKREGIELDLLVGCSGGTLFATMMALDADLNEVESMTKALWTRQVTASRNLKAVASVFLPKLFSFDSQFSLINDEALNEKLEASFGHKTFGDAKIPLHISTTDLHTGEKVVLSEGRVMDAIRASIAIPYVWPAWQVGDRWLVDGCLSNPLPVDVAIREGADIILAMGFEAEYPRKIKSATRYAFQLNSVYTNNLLRASYAFHNLAHHAEIIPILPQFDSRVGLFDTGKFPYVIEMGEKTAEQQLPYLRQLIESDAD
jgi:NTE family protein